MKKLFLLLIMAAILAPFASAQKGKVSQAEFFLEENDLSKAKEAIERAVEHKKSFEWTKTYLVRGNVYAELYRETKDIKNLQTAIDSYKKAMELDEKGDSEGKGAGRFTTELKNTVLLFRNEVINAAVEKFNQNDFESAYTYFKEYLDLGDTYLFKQEGDQWAPDTAVIYNTGLAALNADMHEEAIEYLEKSADLGYGGVNTWLLIKQEYEEMGDSAKGIDILHKAYELYPDGENSVPILMSLIDYYLKFGTSDEALEYIEKGIEKDPENSILYFAKGNIYDKMGETDTALVLYENAVENNDTLVNAFFNIGVIYYNRGAEVNNEAQAENDDTKYNALIKKAEEQFNIALKNFEKAYELEPTECAILDNLKTLYYRFQMMDKYEKISEELKNCTTSP